MLTVLLSWIYILFTTYIVGYMVFYIFHKIFAFRMVENLFYIIICGMLCITVYAEYFSLFYKVGAIANIVLLTFCLISLGFAKKAILTPIKSFLCQNSQIYKNVLMASILILSIVTASEIRIGDTYLYHAQSIRWIEEYGCVPGAANLNWRIGFNSAMHSFNALYSFAFVRGVSIHTGTGWCALILLAFSMQRVLKWRNHKYHISDVFCIGAMVYVLIDSAWISSPITDTPANCILFFILICWSQLIEESATDSNVYIFLCFLGLYCSTLKLSTAIIVLIAAIPAKELIKNKKWVNILGYCCIGLIIMLPYIIRNILLTGWFVYPFSAIDFFNVDWKLSKDIVIVMSNAVTNYARGVADWAGSVSSDFSWLSTWFIQDSVLHQLLYIITFGYTIIQIAIDVIDIAKKRYMYKKWYYLHMVICVGLIYWIIRAPHVRFGWPYLLFFTLTTPLFLICKYENKKVVRLGKMMILCSSILMALNIGLYTMRTLQYLKEGIGSYLFFQADYEKIPSDEIKEAALGNGEVLYYTFENANAGYYTFPALETQNLSDKNHIHLRGKEIKDGFYNDRK